jgi:hypothetical protein
VRYNLALDGLHAVAVLIVSSTILACSLEDGSASTFSSFSAAT